MNIEYIDYIDYIFSIGVIIFLGVYFYLQNNWVELEHITIKINNLPEGLHVLKIAHISDLHIPNNASDIDSLAKLVKNESPDIIVMTGDLIYKHKTIREKELGRFCRRMSDIARTYAVTGNHEAWNDTEKWYEILDSNNVKVIDNSFDVYEKNGSSVIFMGLKEGFKYHDIFWKSVIEENVPKILLSHRPELFQDYCSGLNSVKPDIVFCGHAHGGQFRVPFINKGIYSPEQGIFPKYTSGLYESHNKTYMVVSRGLGNSAFRLRINNRVHIPVVTLWL